MGVPKCEPGQVRRGVDAAGVVHDLGALREHPGGGGGGIVAVVGAVAAAGEVARVVVPHEGDVGGADAQRAAEDPVGRGGDGRADDGVDVVLDGVDDRVAVLVDADEARVQPVGVVQEQQPPVREQVVDGAGAVDQVGGAEPSSL